MNTKFRLMNPATIAALFLFAGTTSTAPVIADDQATSQMSGAPSEQIEKTSKEQARQANEAAVEEAARAVAVETRLDLDSRLIGHTSVSIAGEA